MTMRSGWAGRTVRLYAPAALGALACAVVEIASQAAFAEPASAQRQPVINELAKPWESYAARPLADPAVEPDARTPNVAVGRLQTQGYTHFSVLSRGKDGHLHLFSYSGSQHQSGRASAIDYRTSTDQGATWTTRRLLDGAWQGLDWRIGASGVTGRGRLILMLVRIDLATATNTLGSIYSDDGGRTWSEYAELRQAPPSPFGGKGSQIATYGQIKLTPSGRLVMMAYVGPFNFSMTSDDQGATWRRTTIIHSDVSYSETAVQPIDDLNWVAVSRIDKGRTQMAQFVTFDGGATWRELGPLNLPLTAGYVSPSLDLVQAGRRATLVLGVTDRSTGQSVLRVADPGAALESAQVWSGPRVFANGLRVRSGYQTTVADPKCARLVIANHRETSGATATIEITMMNYSDLLPGHAPHPVSTAACPVIR